MTTTTSRAALAATAGVLALTLTACSGGGSGDGDGSASSEPEPGPLDAYFEQMYGSADEEDGMAQMRRIEEITAECMQEQGFEYTPVDHSQNAGFAMEPEELDVEWGTVEFAEKYGYGITTDPWGGQEPPMPEEGEEFVDPNQERVEAMSDTERQAYEAALWGEPQVFDEATEGEEMPVEEWDWTKAGCSGKAQNEVYDSANGMEDEEFTALQEEMQRMWETVEADPRLTELNSDWASCMADAGFPGLAKVGDAETAVYDETNAINEEAYADVDYSEDLSEEEYVEIDAQIQEEVREKLAAITPREIETAVADATCREDLGYTEIQHEVNVEHQQEFVDANKAELDAWLASVEAARP